MKLVNIDPISLIWGYPSVSFLKATKGNMFFVPEMRPSLAGLVISESLCRENKTVYITDNMLGILFYKKKIKDIFFFYKYKKNNMYTGICGSLYVYALAKAHNVSIMLYEGENNKITEKKEIRNEFPFANYYIEALDESFYLEVNYE
jgi:methylthioribose-1-phosphate isomerase